MSDDLITCEFRVNGEVVESVQIQSVPRKGERIEVGAMFDPRGNRIDPSDSDAWHRFDSEYKTVLSGTVTQVTRHYATEPRRSSLTAYVDVEPEGER